MAGEGLSDVFIPVMVMVFEGHSYLFIGYTKFFMSNLMFIVQNYAVFCRLISSGDRWKKYWPCNNNQACGLN